MKDFAKSGINRYRLREGMFGSNDSAGNYGMFIVPVEGSMPVRRLIVMASCGDDPSEEGWEHVSVHVRCDDPAPAMHTPSWDEMCAVKELFWGPDEAVFQLHPPESDYVNNHNHCLHLWKHKTKETPRPPVHLVGVK